MKTINCKSVLSILMAMLFSNLISASLWATGPRISESFLAPNKNQIYASDFPPFATTELVSGGLNSEIIDAVLKITNIDSARTIVPLQSMVKFYLIQEKALAAYGREANFSESTRKNFIFIPIAVTIDHYIYYKPAHKMELTWNGELKSFKGLTYGAYKGENVAALKKYDINIKTGRVHSLLKKLLSNKVDFIKLSALNQLWMLDRYFPDEKINFSKIKKSGTVKPLFILFNKKHANGSILAEKFKKGLSEVIASGQYQKILEKYVSDNAVREQKMKALKEYIKEYK